MTEILSLDSTVPAGRYGIGTLRTLEAPVKALYFDA
jgi:hypothetical protein